MHELILKYATFNVKNDFVETNITLAHVNFYAQLFSRILKE